jgi:MFS family permease
VNIRAHPAIAASTASGVESRYAWTRLAASTLLSTIGNVGMWSVVVVLPALQTEFGVARADASLPYALAMAGFACGSAVVGRLVDRFGIVAPAVVGTLALSLGYVAAGYAPSLWIFVIAHGVLIGLGGSATFAPLIADISHWFARRRGIAVAICATGNSLAGVVWPPLIQHFIATVGWRQTHVGIGLCCAVTMLPLILILRHKAPDHRSVAGSSTTGDPRTTFGLAPNALQAILVMAGVACCVAMATPQVQMVAYCADLGYGVTRGAEMLSVMIAFTVISRIGSGWIADRIGGLPTMLLNSTFQAAMLLVYVGFNGLAPLYVISALFGLALGGLVPTYAIIVREYFSPQEAATRVGLVLMATLMGMALGGWMTGAIFDLTGSYRAVFLAGFAWNLFHVSLVLWLLLRRGQRMAVA